MIRPLPPGKASAVADAGARNWVDRFAPAALVPFLRLARADRPIGFFLLAFPCFWSVSLAARSLGDAYPDPWLLVLFAIGALVMRGAGCTYNDLIDRDLDAQVARTRGRPLPSGQLSPRAAVIFMLVLCLIGLAVLLSFNGTTIWLGLGVLPIVALYPFVKRFSHWPQVVLGLAFNWGALLGWAAHAHELAWAALVLYAAGIAWTLFYDTIYAHQDREDDALIGVKSTARLFGTATRRWLAGFLVATVLLAGLAVLATGQAGAARAVALIGVAGLGGHLAWQLRRLDIDDPALCLRLFRSNRDAGLILAGALVLAAVLAAPA